MVTLKGIVVRLLATLLLPLLGCFIFSLMTVQRVTVVVPYNENDLVLATFNASCLSPDCPILGEGFFFGMATAPAHVEDELEDSWLEFAMRGTNVGPKRGPVRAFHNHAKPGHRLGFWTNPDVELDLVKETGVEAYRLGVDWGRLVPVEPVAGTAAVYDKAVAARYREIIQAARARNLRIMLTLFHHSLPKWALAYGGWTMSKTVAYFVEFTKLAKDDFGDLVDYWCTFNEPTLFAIMTSCLGAWPPGTPPTLIGSALCFTPVGAYGISMANIATAHNLAYTVLHEGGSTIPVGVAHATGWQRAYSLVDGLSAKLTDMVLLYSWIDQIVDKLDYCGLNYYGQEFVSIAGPQLVPDEEYSEAGRAVYPEGLYHLLMAFHARYSPGRPKLRYIITENGIADATDTLRRAYLVEHMLALDAAIKQGVPVDGYFHWTLSDNWEWADGYCPRFGLVAVDRDNDMKRTPRPSFYLFQDIVKTRQVTNVQRTEAWGTLMAEARKGGVRPFCRRSDYAGRQWWESSDEAHMRRLSTKDWRFGHYPQPSLATSLRRTVPVLATIVTDLVRGVIGKPANMSLLQLERGEL
eukprot:TRINITY_DN38654_c0_g1_i1.p1 TRINITY_DN38654_c0_g1~~TRINITY_DN38654_c0_g1_i1.p1  ORF type:complete len:580 (-),score=90.92 TRINITY_DN38654_c0_g1_i1:1067-2806(-)